MADNNITDNLLQAMSIVMDAQIKKYKYDVTIEARIVSTEQKEDGIYKVEYEDAIFDAYSDNSQYYEGDTVYVHVPKGDFSQQKHIVGRKVDLDKEPEKTFKFKRPFDDFIQLDNLTYDDKDSLSVEHGYLANYPNHGQDKDAIDYSIELENLTSELNQLEDKHKKAKKEIQNYVIATPKELSKASEGYSIKDQYPDKSQKDYYSIIEQILALNPQTLTQLDNAIKQANEQLLIAAKVYQEEPLYINANDLADIKAMMVAAKDRLAGYIDDIYDEDVTRLQNEQIKYQGYSNTQETSKEGNVDWIYTWRNTKNEPVLFTNLGVSIDVRTLLGNYRPQSGKYGLKLVIRGLTRPSEETASVSKVETVYFRNTEDFYGNTYAYYTPYTQQKLFNISNYLRIDRIDVYFWQDHNFLDETFTVIPYEDRTGNLYPANIIISNLTLSMGVDVNEFDVDKVFLYTYDDLSYGKDPLSGESRAEKDSRELQFAWVHKLDDGSAELINTPEQLKEYNAHIYWYHYKYGVVQDTTKYAEQQGGINWDWLEEEKGSIALDDQNQPMFDENGNQIYSYDKFTINVTPDISTAREKYRAILEYNKIPLRSDPIEMWNIDSTVVTSTDDLTNEIVFRLLREDKDGNIVEDNTLGNFYVYDENNLCIYDDENVKYSNKWYYIQVWIRNNDNGAYSPLCIDDNPDSFDIKWTIPKQMTMISQCVDVGDRDLDKAILMPTSASISANQNDNIRKVTKKFRIRDRWDLKYTENTISAQITRNGRKYNLQKELHFGQSGSMGSEFTITIHQKEPNSPYLIQNQPFVLWASVADQYGNEIPSIGYQFKWELLSPTIITNWKDTENEGNYNGNKLTGIITNDLPPIIRVTIDNAASYSISQTTGFKLTDSQSFNTKYVVSVPNRVEFKSDGKAPITMTSNFWVAAINETDGTVSKEVYPDWKLVQYYKPSYGKVWELLDEPDYFGLKESVQLKREIANNTENPVLYIELNADGTIDYTARILSYNFSSTTILPEHKIAKMLYNDICVLAESEYSAAIDAVREQYPDYINNDEQQKLYQKAVNDAEQRYNDYIDKINYAAGKWVPECTRYALDPYMNKNLQTSTAWAWDDLMLKNYYTYIGFESNGEDGLPYYMRQAIAMTRNEYSSSLVNSWDGSLLVDKENNAFLSKMVSAGSKDSDNRFTGVMMGDWADNGDTSIDKVGIYGFERGAQVFGLKTDGTGFIGKAGKGQIQFDGNYSLISNYDKSCYINLDPIKFNGLGALDERTTMGYSSYFLYAKVPKASTASAMGEATLEGSTYWATTFMNDTANDYFVVDPNNGILTTGGIIARYGKLGNWMISSDGLYQKSLNPETGKIDKYMYLGYKQKHAAEQYDANPELDENNEPITFDINTIEDENYAIWCAESDNPYLPPYFAVDWDGTMRARKGYIGLKTPWKIDDYGLTQKNNFGIIYLGAPKKYLTDKNLDETDESLDDFIMWAGQPTFFTDDGKEQTIEKSPELFDATKAYFSILADGTIFSRRGQIGGWTITDHNLASLDNGPGRVRFNSEYGQILLGERTHVEEVLENGSYIGGKDNSSNFSILLDGNTGRIVLKHQENYLDSNGDTVYDNFGEIWLANYIIGSSSNKKTEYTSIVGSMDDLPQKLTQKVSGGSGSGSSLYGGYHYSYYSGSKTINYTPANIIDKGKLVTDQRKYTLSKDNDLLVFKTNTGLARGTGIYVTAGALSKGTTKQKKLSNGTITDKHVIKNNVKKQSSDNFYLTKTVMTEYYNQGKTISHNLNERQRFKAASDQGVQLWDVETITREYNQDNQTFLITAQQETLYKYPWEHNIPKYKNGKVDPEFNNKINSARTDLAQRNINFFEYEYNNVVYFLNLDTKINLSTLHSDNPNLRIQFAFTALKITIIFEDDLEAINSLPAAEKNLFYSTITSENVSRWQVIFKLEEDTETLNSWYEVTTTGLVVEHEEEVDLPDTTKNMVIVYPDSEKTVIGVLGTTDRRWNILADNISSNSISVESGVIAAYRLFEEGERVATVPYVYSQLKPIWDAIAGLQGAAGGQAEQLGRLGSGLNQAAVAGGAIFGYYNGGSYQPGFFLYNKGGGTVAKAEAPFRCASDTHGHKVTCTPKGGKITVTVENVISGSSGSDSFDIAATEFYARQIAAAYVKGAIDAIGQINKSSLSIDEFSVDVSCTAHNGYSSGSAYASGSASGKPKIKLPSTPTINWANCLGQTGANITGTFSATGGSTITGDEQTVTDGPVSDTWYCLSTHGGGTVIDDSDGW